MNTLVDPEWGELPAADLRAQGLTEHRLRAAPPFHRLRSRLTSLLAGRRVVCIDRARTYAQLFCGLEWCVSGTWSWVLPDGEVVLSGRVAASARREFSGGCYANGSLVPVVHDEVVDILSTARFECVRLAWSRFLGEWDDRCRPVLADRLVAPRRAADRARAALELLTTMAAAAPSRYRQLCAQAEEAERAGHDQRRTATTRERRARLATTRTAVLLRSGGWCENPTCTDTGYRRDVTDAGEPLLEVHHADGDPQASHARGGRHHPAAALALCRNCHGLVTHGRDRATLNQRLAAAARAAHQRHLASTANGAHTEEQ